MKQVDRIIHQKTNNFIFYIISIMNVDDLIHMIWRWQYRSNYVLTRDDPYLAREGGGARYEVPFISVLGTRVRVMSLACICHRHVCLYPTTAYTNKILSDLWICHDVMIVLLHRHLIHLRIWSHLFVLTEAVAPLWLFDISWSLGDYPMGVIIPEQPISSVIWLGSWGLFH